MALGDSSMDVIAAIMSQTRPCTIDLSKNNFSDVGLKRIAQELKNSTSLFHVSLSGNQITTEGAQYLFSMLDGHQYLTSLELQNRDCYKQKIKIGTKGAQILQKVLSNPNCLISNLELTDAALTS